MLEFGHFVSYHNHIDNQTKFVWLFFQHYICNFMLCILNLFLPINFCCVDASGLWKFITAALGPQYTGLLVGATDLMEWQGLRADDWLGCEFQKGKWRRFYLQRTSGHHCGWGSQGLYFHLEWGCEVIGIKLDVSKVHVPGCCMPTHMPLELSHSYLFTTTLCQTKSDDNAFLFEPVGFFSDISQEGWKFPPY